MSDKPMRDALKRMDEELASRSRPGNAGPDLKLLPEETDERRMIDASCASMGWTALEYVANSLFVERNTAPEGGSFRAFKAIAFNEVTKAIAALASPPATPSPSVIDFLKQWTSRESRPVIDVARDMAKAWDKGEHEGCGADSERAFKTFQARATQPASPAAGREEIARVIYDAFPFEPRHGMALKPAWQDGGNSTMQGEARRAADAILALGSAVSPQDGRAAVIEECAKVCDDVVARADRLMDDPKASRMTLAAVSNGAMECAENVRALALPRAEREVGS